MEEERGGTPPLRRSKSSRSTLTPDTRRRRRSSSPYRANATSFTVGNGSSVSLLHTKIQDNPEKISYALSDIPEVYKEDRSTGKAVVSILSGLYGLLLVAAGVVLVTSTRVPPTVTQGFYLFLYCAGGAMTVFLLHCKQKSLTEDEATESINVSTGMEASFGTLYLRISTVGFGVLVMLYIGLELIQSVQCKDHILLVLTTAAWLGFTLLQTLLVFRSGTWGWVMSRIILSHLLACNVCIWYQSYLHNIRQRLPTETEIVFMNIEESNTTTFTSAPIEGGDKTVANISQVDDWDCDSINMIDTLEQYAVPLLYPCTVEYSVLCIFIILSMWRNATTVQHSFPIHDGLEHPGLKIEEDWQCGLFCGLLVLVGTAISLVLYFVLCQEPGFEYLSSMMLDITILALLLLSILATLLLCIARTRQRNGGTGVPSSPVDAAVLWVAQGGVFFSHLFSITTQLLVVEVSATRLSVSLVTVLHSVVLTPFLLAPRKAPNAARQLLGFTLAVLVSLVVVCHLDYVRMTEEKHGHSLWISARHIFGPLRLLYYVQTTVTVWHLLRESCQSSEMYL